MWDDVIIGIGDKGNSSRKVFDIEGLENVSQNNVSYWINDCILGLGMTIFKNTDAGLVLTKMIKEKKRAVEIQTWLDEVVLANVEPARIKTAIKKKIRQAFADGSNARAAEIRNVLAYHSA